MMRTVLAMTAVAVGITAVMAQGDPIAQRKALMKSNGQNSGALNRMVKGEDPFDAAKAAAAYDKLAETASKVGPLFASPPPAGADTRALPKIWRPRPTSTPSWRRLARRWPTTKARPRRSTS